MVNLFTDLVAVERSRIGLGQFAVGRKMAEISGQPLLIILIYRLIPSDINTPRRKQPLGCGETTA